MNPLCQGVALSGLLRRADVALRHRVTLADVADLWVQLHGDRTMVIEEGVVPETVIDAAHAEAASTHTNTSTSASTSPSTSPSGGGGGDGDRRHGGDGDRRHGGVRPDRSAPRVVHELTYREAAQRVARWSAAIAARTRPGESVVIATTNGIDQFLLCLASSRVGRIPAPVNPQMRPVEVDHVIADSGASLVVRGVAELDSGPGSRSAPPEPATPSLDDVAALFYTSGTTGTPKGVELTHRGLIGGLTPVAAFPSWLRSDEIVLSLPVAHIMGFISVMGPTLAGVPMYFIRHFDATRVLDVIEERRSSAFMGVPATYRLLDEAGAAERDLSSVRIWMTGADVMPPALAKRFKSYGAAVTLPLIGPVGEAAFFEGYGMVETGGGVVAKMSPPLVPLGLGDSLGFTLPGWKVRVVDHDDRPVPMGTVGELQIRGPGVLRGYHGDAAATSDVMTGDGWLRSGDLVRSGPFGLMSFQGRSKNVIKSGGYSVYAVEVEADLEEHRDVLEAGVVGLDDAKLGEVPVAAVRLREGATVTPEELVAWARKRMARYKAPRRIVVVDDLPRTGTRKVRREHLLPLFEALEGSASEAAPSDVEVDGSAGSDRRNGSER